MGRGILVGPLGRIDERHAMAGLGFIDPIIRAFQLRAQSLRRTAAHILLEQNTRFQFPHRAAHKGLCMLDRLRQIGAGKRSVLEIPIRMLNLRG